MAQKIIMFVSPFRPGAVALDYTCPSRNVVTGAQTNEAPSKYLMLNYPRVSRLIGVVTPEAQSAWSYLEDSLERFCAENHLPAPEFIPVPFHTENGFAAEVLPAILEQISPNDEILLETTGGFRNDMMYLLLLSRILSYTNIPVVEAVYSNFQTREIATVSGLFTMFDLAEGMQNLSAFGNVQTLRAYYQNRPAEENVNALLTTMEQLTEAVTLCRTRQIDACMKQFNTALARLEGDGRSDPLLRQLLPVFRSKFGKDGTMTTPTLIRWCVENGMLQQALTVYTEQIPAYLMSPNQGGFLLMEESAVPPPAPPKQDYESRELAYFLRSFLYLPKRTPGTTVGLYNAFRQYIKTHGREIENAAIFGHIPRDVSEELRPAVERVVELVRAAEPCIGTSHWQGRWERMVSSQFSDALFARINEKQYRSVSSMINDFQVFGASLIAELFGHSQPDGSGNANPYVEVIKHLEQYLPNSGYTVICPVEQVKAMAADYIYLKFLRNMTNHANNESLESQRETLDCLKALGYQDIDNISAADLKQAILRALDRLEQTETERISSGGTQ